MEWGSITTVITIIGFLIFVVPKITKINKRIFQWAVSKWIEDVSDDGKYSTEKAILVTFIEQRLFHWTIAISFGLIVVMMVVVNLYFAYIR